MERRWLATGRRVLGGGPATQAAMEGARRGEGGRRKG